MLSCVKYLHCKFSGVRLKHTIYALSSGYGKCGVAVIRVSGPDAKLPLTRMCKRLPPPRRAELRKICDPQTKEILDHGLVIWFPGPASFTGEDCCELQVHGGPAVLSSIFAALAKLEHFRPAEPGEFTRRAFYGGKLDLTSVEGLADLINAETEFQRKQALIQMDGALFQTYSKWRSILSHSLANLEAFIDFEEDENIESTVLTEAKKKLANLHAQIQKHLTDGRRGERLRNGINMTIVGAPNVGKSSLLNFLSKKPTAIVSDIPGTTRDIIKTDLDICGFPVNVQDTAGLREDTSDLVEMEGMTRARNALKETDLTVVVVDARNFLRDPSAQLRKHLDSLGISSHTEYKQCLIIVNKIDLVQDRSALLKLRDSSGLRICLSSCVTEEGTDDLMTCLSSLLEQLCGNPSLDNPCFNQPRHRYCIEEIAKSLDRVFTFSDSEIDLAAQEVRNALHSLGKITGHVSSEDILDIIFKEFCIGK